MNDHLAPGPWHYETTALPDDHDGKGHVYLVDADGRKIGTLWGPAETKIATAKLIINARESAEGVNNATETDNKQDQEVNPSQSGQSVISNSDNTHDVDGTKNPNGMTKELAQEIDEIESHIITKPRF